MHLPIKLVATTNEVCLLFVSNYRLLGAASSESIRCSNFINIYESDLRISVDNTCTDSLVTALDDEALLICDTANEMARTKVRHLCHFYCC